MRIAFNFHGCGSANNGGTRTVFKSAVELSRLGQEVEIWDDRACGLTWFELPPEVRYIVSKNIGEHAPVDALIATGTMSVESTVAFKDKGIGMFWVRAIETWVPGYETAIRKASDAGLVILVNGSWMRGWLGKRGIKSEILRPGLEIDFFKPAEEREHGLVVGALYSHKKRKRLGDVKTVMDAVRESRKDVQLWMLGDDEFKGELQVDRYLRQPSEEDKRAMYQGVDVWFAPTDNEGLHVPPMEAGLCGCALVAHGKDSAGMGDYAIHGKTALIYPEGNLQKAAKHVLTLLNDGKAMHGLADNLRAHLLGEIGSREANMLGFLHRFFHDKLMVETKDRITRENREPTDVEFTLLNSHYDSGQVAKQMAQVKPFIRLAEGMGFRPDAKVLDMGCRDGVFLKALKENGWTELTGLDVCGPSIDKARAAGIFAVKANASVDRVFACSSFDIVRSRNMMEHLPNPAACVKEQLRVLKPGGIIVNHYPIEPDASLKHFSLTTPQSEAELLQQMGPILKEHDAVLDFYGPCGEIGLVAVESKPGLDKAMVVTRKGHGRNVFVNCGSNDGRTTLEFVQQRGNGFRIYSFEVNPHHFPRYAGIPGILVKKAAWVKDETRPFYLGGDPGNKLAIGSSLMREKNNLWNQAPLDVECVDFSAWIAERVSPEDHLVVKMNIEGAEYAILEKMIQDGTIGLIDELFVGWHIHKCDGLIEKDKEAELRKAVTASVKKVVLPVKGEWNYTLGIG